jgi:hypothetical protein
MAGFRPRYTEKPRERFIALPIFHPALDQRWTSPGAGAVSR